MCIVYVYLRTHSTLLWLFQAGQTVCDVWGDSPSPKNVHVAMVSMLDFESTHVYPATTRWSCKSALVSTMLIAWWPVDMVIGDEREGLLGCDALRAEKV